MGECLKGTGKTTSSMAKVIRNFRMGQSTTEHIRTGNLKGMGHTHGTMGRHMKVNGSMDKNTDPGSGEGLKEIPTLGSGNRIKHLGMECIPGLMEIDTKENSKTASNMEKEWKSLPMETLIKVFTAMGNQKDTANTFGPWEASLKGISKTD